MPERGTETGDRASFLAAARGRLAAGVPANPVHPRAPAPPTVPEVRYRALDAGDLAGSFARAAAAVGTEVVLSPGAGPSRAMLRGLVERHAVRLASVTAEPAAVATGEALADLGVRVVDGDTPDAPGADLGVTSAAALVAATGSVVQRVDQTGVRGVSLLPRVHLCVAPADCLVPTPGDVWRPLGAPSSGSLPSNIVVITGPSRTGDIEQILTRGVHGPVAVYVVVTGTH